MRLTTIKTLRLPPHLVATVAEVQKRQAIAPGKRRPKGGRINHLSESAVLRAMLARGGEAILSELAASGGTLAPQQPLPMLEIRETMRRPWLTSGRVCAALGITEHSLASAERRGIVRPVRTPGGPKQAGRRLYEPQDVVALGLALGFEEGLIRERMRAAGIESHDSMTL